jgi:hypothetical protein
MTKLKLSDVQSDKPVKLAIELPAAVHRELTVYAEVLARETGQTVEPAKLIAPMLARAIHGERSRVCEGAIESSKKRSTKVAGSIPRPRT